MTKDEIRAWLLDFQRRSGHHNAPGCEVCTTIYMLLGELTAMPRPYCGPAERRIVDGVVVTGPAA